MKVTYNQMKHMLTTCLIKRGVSNETAAIIAEIMTNNSCDGIASHGLNRFPRMLQYIDDGLIDISATPEVVNSFGNLEVVDGHLGFGVINASFAMNRAIELAKIFGIGCVALRNNNHWMRGATYGLQAVESGVIGICFTNTIPNLPVWGSTDSRVGNNPLIIAVPKGEDGIILDMAMSQFSYGKMESLAAQDKKLPQSGGFDEDGNLTDDPKKILKSQRPLPIGFWKGSGLSLVLDLLATILSSGKSTKDIGEQKIEYGVSQVFITIDPLKIASAEVINEKIEETIEYIKTSTVLEGTRIFYPGEQSKMRRIENKEHGIPVDETIWNQVVAESEKTF